MLHHLHAAAKMDGLGARVKLVSNCSSISTFIQVRVCTNAFCYTVCNFTVECHIRFVGPGHL